MAGEFGAIIEPYRVAPAQGGMDDWFMMQRQRQLASQELENQLLARATRAYLGEVMGLPQGTDPMAVQTYRGEEQRQDIVGNQDERAGQDHQAKYDFAKGFMGNLPQQNDPYLNALQAAGVNPIAAEALVNALGGQFNRRDELTNRREINQDDNAAAEQRLRAELEIRNQNAIAEEARKQGLDAKREQKIQAAYAKGMTTGDFSEYYSLVPNASMAPVMYDREADAQGKAAQRAVAQKRQQDRQIILERTKNKKANEIRVQSKPDLAPVEPNKFFDPRVVTPHRQGDSALQRQYTNLGNLIGFYPKTFYYGSNDISKAVLDWLDETNFRW